MISLAYDSGNRLIQVGTAAYTYDANDNRIASAIGNSRTQYAYENAAARMSQLLVRTNPDGSQTFYVYGLGLIGQQDSTGYSVYHFDFRGSTVALTNSSGAVTDRFTYGAYGELLTHIGSSDTPFLYNGHDGVLAEANGLYYMRTRYYSPELKRFLNADIKKGSIDNIQTLNLYNFVVGNPILFVDPTGASAELGISVAKTVSDIGGNIATAASVFKEFKADSYVWETRLKLLKSSKAFKSFSDKLAYLGIGLEVAADIYTDYQNGAPLKRIITDSIIDIAVTGTNIAISSALVAAIGGVFMGPVGSVIGAVVTAGISAAIQYFIIDSKWNSTEDNLQEMKDTVYAAIGG